MAMNKECGRKQEYCDEVLALFPHSPTKHSQDILLPLVKMYGHAEVIATVPVLKVFGSQVYSAVSAPRLMFALHCANSV